MSVYSMFFCLKSNLGILRYLLNFHLNINLPMKCIINGKEIETETRPDETAVEVIRERLRITGTKISCGQGVCGACTILVDSVPTLSCLLPADHLEGKKVETIEVHHRDNLHPVQKAFMVCDGLQCGYCTPGFINAAIGFFNRWRNERGKTKPGKKEIADALSGNLCRCGAHLGIFEAVARACAGEFDDLKEIVPARLDAIEKVTGEAKYTTDVFMSDQLIGKFLRSQKAHARIKKIDTSAVVEMIELQGIVPFLKEGDMVRYIGQEILAIAATDRLSAQMIVDSIRVEYEELPVITDIESARAAKNPLVYTETKDRKKAPNAAEGIIPPGRWKGNVRQPLMNIISKAPGKARRRIKKARKKENLHLVEGTWKTQTEIHTALEPHACLAKWEGEKKLTVFLSTQACDLMSREIASQFDLKPEDVQVLCKFVGGGFGAKLGLTAEAVAAIRLARMTELPVKMVLNRAEEMTVGGSRPEAHIDLAMVADNNRDLKALSAKAYTNSGVGINAMVASLMRLIYPGAAKELVDFDVVTNFPPGKPFRGPSGPLTCWALEQAVDAMAEKLEEDPITLRKKWDNHTLRKKLYDQAAKTELWQQRPKTGSEKGRYKRGVGLAAGNWFNFYHPKTEVKVTASAKGFSVMTATQDMGNGTNQMLASIVAEVMEIQPQHVTVFIGHSKAVQGPMSGGSRTTNSLYSPTRTAAQKVKAQLLQAVKEQFGVINPAINGNGVQHDGGLLNWREIFRSVATISVIEKRGTDAKGIDWLSLIPIGADDVSFGSGFSGSVYVAEVEVDTLLGKTKVNRVWGGLAVGKIVAPKTALSQCYGGVIQGIGYALYEERQVDLNTGNILSLGLEDYKIPGMGDIPEIEIYFLEEGFDQVKGGVVGLGEISTIPVAASIGNAVFNATGWQPKVLPIRPDRIVMR